VMLAVLVSTSVPMRLASRAVRAGRLAATRRFLLWALVVQAGYLAYELYDYRDQLHRFDATSGAYGSIYFTLLGAHHTHVAVGLLLDVWFLLRLSTGLTRYRLGGLWATTVFWHFVNGLAVLVVLTQLSPAL
jgi:cytochrome c oxidase subunit III